MRLRTGTISLALALIAAALQPARAREAPSDAEMRAAHAALLGLAQDGTLPERDEMADVYYSIVDNPEAPRLVTRLEVSGAPCRARATSALQFPGKWAVLTLDRIDLARVTRVTAYASVDDMIAEANPVPLDSPAARQVVLTGEGLFCSSRLSLSGGASRDSCADRLDLSMMDEEQQARGRSALAIVADFCKAPAFRKR